MLTQQPSPPPTRLGGVRVTRGRSPSPSRSSSPPPQSPSLFSTPPPTTDQTTAIVDHERALAAAAIEQAVHAQSLAEALVTAERARRETAEEEAARAADEALAAKRALDAEQARAAAEATEIAERVRQEVADAAAAAAAAEDEARIRERDEAIVQATFAARAAASSARSSAPLEAATLGARHAAMAARESASVVQARREQLQYARQKRLELEASREALRWLHEVSRAWGVWCDNALRNRRMPAMLRLSMDKWRYRTLGWAMQALVHEARHLHRSRERTRLLLRAAATRVLHAWMTWSTYTNLAADARRQLWGGMRHWLRRGLGRAWRAWRQQRAWRLVQSRARARWVRNGSLRAFNGWIDMLQQRAASLESLRRSAARLHHRRLSKAFNSAVAFCASRGMERRLILAFRRSPLPRALRSWMAFCTDQDVREEIEERVETTVLRAPYLRAFGLWLDAASSWRSARMRLRSSVALMVNQKMGAAMHAWRGARTAIRDTRRAMRWWHDAARAHAFDAWCVESRRLGEWRRRVRAGISRFRHLLTNKMFVAAWTLWCERAATLGGARRRIAACAQRMLQKSLTAGWMSWRVSAEMARQRARGTRWWTDNARVRAFVLWQAHATAFAEGMRLLRRVGARLVNARLATLYCEWVAIVASAAAIQVCPLLYSASHHLPHLPHHSPLLRPPVSACFCLCLPAFSSCLHVQYHVCSPPSLTRSIGGLSPSLSQLVRRRVLARLTQRALIDAFLTWEETVEAAVIYEATLRRYMLSHISPIPAHPASP